MLKSYFQHGACRWGARGLGQRRPEGDLRVPEASVSLEEFLDYSPSPTKHLPHETRENAGHPTARLTGVTGQLPLWTALRQDGRRGRWRILNWSKYLRKHVRLRGPEFSQTGKAGFFQHLHK